MGELRCRFAEVRSGETPEPAGGTPTLPETYRSPLTSGTLYHARLRAIGTAGPTAWSDPVAAYAI